MSGPLAKPRAINGIAIGVPAAGTTDVSKTAGFTLMEVAIAIVILSLSFSVLISFQVGLFSSYKREDYLEKASLYANYIMTTMEAAEEAPEPGTKEGDLESLLKKSGYLDEEVDETEMSYIRSFRYHRNVDSVNLEPLEDVVLEDILRHVELKLTWGKENSLTVNYYIKNDKN